MKTPDQLVADITRRLTNTWHTDAAGTTDSWPHSFPLGKPTKTDLDTNYAVFHRNVVTLQDWAQDHNVDLTYDNRRVLGTTQAIPTHATVPDLARAVHIAENGWPQRLMRAAVRRTSIRDRFPNVTDLPRLLRAVDGYNETDFDLLLTVADWFTHNDATGYTPRQVPIPGVHAKWLNTHQPQLLALTGQQTLGLLPRHPARIHFTYLDPHHRAAGGRWHDSATVGDPFAPAYNPTVVLISENKDTAINFLPTPGGIAIEGDGFGGKTAAAFPWLTGAPRLYYWGDIDTHGYEILNGYRADGVPVTSILMDTATYDTYEPFGTNTAPNGMPLKHWDPKPLPHLTDQERAAYDRIIDPDWAGHRRIEQERIPLQDARDAIEATLHEVRDATDEFGTAGSPISQRNGPTS